MNDSEPLLVDQGEPVRVGGLIHRVKMPRGTGPFPTVVMLHGRSGSENAMWIFASAVPENWLVVAPRGIKPDLDRGYAWHPRQRDEWPSLLMFDEAVGAIQRFTGTLPQFYGADPERTYFMGFSQGAAAAYATAMRKPVSVKGIAGLLGFVPVESSAALETAALKGIPIFMAVGIDDPYISHQRTQSCAQTLREAGALLDYHEYETGHRMNSQGMRDLRAWWQQQAGN